MYVSGCVHVKLVYSVNYQENGYFKERLENID